MALFTKSHVTSDESIEKDDSWSGKDVERTSERELGVLIADQAGFDAVTGVKQGLATRHVSMMALAGIIGPGLLIGAGSALAKGGPAALLIGFGVIGVIAWSVMQSLGEMTTLFPGAGGFLTLTDRFLNRPFCFIIGWNYFVVWVAVLANEYNVLGSILLSWSDKVPIYGYILLFWAAFTGFQLLGVAAFGEAEFWLALLKIIGLLAFFIFSIVYMSGGVAGTPAFGFHYWNEPGAFATGFRGMAQVFIFCSTFYAGIESIAVAATETKDPLRAIPMAIRQVIKRILFVYIGSAIFFGATVPWDSTGLTGGASKALKSPMTIAIQRAGWEGGVHLINAFILITCLSATNSSIYIGSRTVLFLSHVGCAPKFMAKTSKRGTPWVAILFTQLFGFLSLMNISTGAAEAYNYIVNLSGVSIFIVWAGLSLAHLRFRAAWKAQLHNIADLPYKATLYPWNAYFSIIINIVLALVQGWTYLVPFDAGNFVDAYILLPLSAVLYIGIAWWTKEFKWKPAGTIDLNTGRRFDLESQPPPPKGKWYHLF